MPTLDADKRQSNLLVLFIPKRSKIGGFAPPLRSWVLRWAVGQHFHEDWAFGATTPRVASWFGTSRS
jgi:hypothetical protein